VRSIFEFRYTPAENAPQNTFVRAALKHIEDVKGFPEAGMSVYALGWIKKVHPGRRVADNYPFLVESLKDTKGAPAWHIMAIFGSNPNDGPLFVTESAIMAQLRLMGDSRRQERDKAKRTAVKRRGKERRDEAEVRGDDSADRSGSKDDRKFPAFKRSRSARDPSTSVSPSISPRNRFTLDDCLEIAKGEMLQLDRTPEFHFLTELDNRTRDAFCYGLVSFLFSSTPLFGGGTEDFFLTIVPGAVEMFFRLRTQYIDFELVKYFAQRFFTRRDTLVPLYSSEIPLNANIVLQYSLTTIDGALIEGNIYRRAPGGQTIKETYPIFFHWPSKDSSALFIQFYTRSNYFKNIHSSLEVPLGSSLSESLDRLWVMSLSDLTTTHLPVTPVSYVSFPMMPPTSIPVQTTPEIPNGLGTLPHLIPTQPNTLPAMQNSAQQTGTSPLANTTNSSSTTNKMDLLGPSQQTPVIPSLSQSQDSNNAPQSLLSLLS